MQWKSVSVSKPKRNTMLAFRIGSRSLFLANIDGRLFCAKNECPHEGIALTLGCLKGYDVRCSLHGFSFDLKSGISDEVGVDGLKTYAVKEENQQIFIQL